MFASEHPFDVLVHRQPEQLRVAEAALLFARDRFPNIRIGPYLEGLECLARRVARFGATSTVDQVQALRAVLVEEEGFHGNAADYYDPDNSYLNVVIERRAGIPITLSAVWLDVCERLGWPFVGIGLPGHYLVACLTPGEKVLADPFGGGRMLTRGECERLVSHASGSAVRLTHAHFSPSSKRATLVRMLNNLRAIYLKRHAWYDAACVLRRLLALDPKSEVLQSEHAAVLGQLAMLN